MFRVWKLATVLAVVTACWAASGASGMVDKDREAPPASPPRQVLPGHDLKANYVPGRVLVGLKASAKPGDRGAKGIKDPRAAEVAQALKAEDARVATAIEAVLPGKVKKQVFRAKQRQVVVMELASGQSVEEVVKQNWRAKDARIEYVEPDYLVYAQNTPTDPLFVQQWDMHNTGQSGGMSDADVDAPEAWDVRTSTAGVIVGLIDSGVDCTHPDLAANLWTNGNGEHGYDFLADDADPSDAGGHGTHTAGTIAAVPNNGIGVAGVAWSTQVMALRFIDASGSGPTSAAVDAIQYALANGAKVLSNSWGNMFPSQALYDAIAEARDEGVLFVAAAGNYGLNVDIDAHYPSGYDLDNIISVASTDCNDQLSSFSDYGRSTVDLAAPGGHGAGIQQDPQDVLSTWPAYTPLFSEDFQSVTPPAVGGFQMDGPNNHWGTIQGADGNIRASADYDHYPFVANADGSLVTPEYNTVGLRGLRLRYRYHLPVAYYTYNLSVDLWNGSNWTTLKMYNQATADRWYMNYIDLKAYRCAQMKIRFRWVTFGSAGVVAAADIDDVALEYIGTDYTNAYNRIAGTSMATPHVAAAAALVWSKYPDLDYAGVKARLMQTADPLSSLQGKCVSGGRLNLYNALAPVRNVTRGTWHDSIQAAINAAQANDEIIVSPGTYYEHINFNNMNLNLHSMNPNNPAIVSSTIIDGSDTDTVVRLPNDFYAGATLSGFTITHGHSTNAGGGVSGGGTALVVISNCIIQNNTGWHGGGVSTSGALVTNCTIQNNTAQRAGGVFGASVRNCKILNNTATADGGALCECTPVENCTIAGNHANSGGAVGTGSLIPIRNCLIVGNSATYSGGAFYGSSIAATGCTIANNNAGTYGGAAHSSSMTFNNCIFWGNTATTAGAQLGLIDSESELHINYCDVQGGQAGVHNDDDGYLDWGANNIVADPLFRDPIGADGNAITWADNDYHIGVGSPSIAAGDPNYTPLGGETDMDAQPRVANLIVDIGADEYCHNVFHVPADFATIQQAISATQWPGDEVVVANGTYSGSGNTNLSFGGKNIVVRSENGSTFCTINCAGGSPAFYLHEQEDNSAVVDGFTITSGNVRGIYCADSSPTIRNCVVRQCSYPGKGSSSYYGGAIRCENSNAVITDCQIVNNTVNNGPTDFTYGAAFALVGCGSPTIRDCWIAGNGGNETYGAGVLVYAYGNPRIDSCVFANNVGAMGTGINVMRGDPTVSNCTFVGNAADAYGGAVLCQDGNLTITNSILWGNTAGTDGSQIALLGYATNAIVNLSYDDLQDGWSGICMLLCDETDDVNWQQGNITSDPLFVDASNGNYRLSCGSPCIDAGDPEGDYTGRTDLDGRSRLLGSAVDMGAYESTPLSVDAGDDTSGCEGDSVTLHATASGPDGAVFSYSWTQTAGKSVTLTGADTASPSFTIPTVALLSDTPLVFQVTVSDGCGSTTANDSVAIVAYIKGDINRDNQVNAADQNLLMAAWGSGPDYHGPEDLNGDGFVNIGDLQVLTANWGRSLQAVLVTVGSVPSCVYEGWQVGLTCSAVSAYGYDLSYSWTQTAGLPVTLSGADTTNTSFSVPTLAYTADRPLKFRVTVTDGHGGSATANVTVQAYVMGDINHDNFVNVGDQQLLTAALGSGPDYHGPEDLNGDGFVNVGDTQLFNGNWGRSLAASLTLSVGEVPAFVYEGRTVYLSCTATSARGYPLTYSWTRVYGTASLSGANTANPHFTVPTLEYINDEWFGYTVRVSDGHGGTLTSEEVWVNGFMMGDVTHDYRVDSSDTAAVTAALGSTPSDPNWNAAADLNNDGTVSSADQQLVTNNLGREQW